MKKLESNLLENLFGEDFPVRRAIFCTYGFDPEYFSEVIYPELLKRRCERTLILMDADQYKSMSVISNLGSAGRVVLERYPAGQLFHPKVYVTAGNGRARGVVGSANLTRAGFEKNWELFTAFNENECDLSRLIDWLDMVAKQTGLGASAKKILHETSAELHAAKLGQPNLPLFPFVWNGSQSPKLWKQLDDITQGKKLKKAIVLSPYFEAPESFDHGLLDNWLSKGLHVDLYVSRDLTQSQIPRAQIKTLIRKYPGRLNLLGLLTEGRLLHAKLIILMDKSQAWVLSGSANFTNAALKGKNIEAGVLLTLSRSDVEKYIKQLLPKAQLLQPDELPVPKIPSIQPSEKISGFLVSAVLSLEHDRLTLELNCSCQELSGDPETLFYVDIGGQSLRLSNPAVLSEKSIVISPANAYLRLSDETWQLGTVTLHSADNAITDWRLIEIAEGESIEEDGSITGKPLDFEMFIGTLFNPRRLSQSTFSHGKQLPTYSKEKPVKDFEDVEGELDRVYRLVVQIESHFGRVMTDPYTVHRWRSDWLRFYDFFSTELTVWGKPMRAFLCARLLTRLEECVNMDQSQARIWLHSDIEFASSVHDMLRSFTDMPDIKIPVLLKTLPVEHV